MNQMTIAGHLGADPEVRFTSSGKKVTTLRVATRARRGTKDKEEDDTIWWRVTVWGEQFDKMIPYFKKGSPIIVFGELSKPEIFTDREGRSHISMNITAFNLQFSPFGKPDSSHSSSSSAGEAKETNYHSDMVYAGADQVMAGQGKADPAMSHNDDEIPF
jgi:single-strand DNA-binding protein